MDEQARLLELFKNKKIEEDKKKLEEQLKKDEELAKKLSQDLNIKPQIPTKPNFSAVEMVRRMSLPNSEASKLFKTAGLKCYNTAWEDTARNKNSSYGENICDMTLQVGSNLMPIIRLDNFNDITWDVPMEKIPLVVGNHIPSYSGNVLYTVSLKEYLQTIEDFLTEQVFKNNLYAPNRDSHVVMSTQSCFLPVPKGDESIFNVALFNYQLQRTGVPAVLSIVATSRGTSAQIIDESGYQGQKLYFNKDGQKCSFVGQRLTIEQGLDVKGPMNKQEKQDNMILIIQVPLKYEEDSDLDEDEYPDFEIYEKESYPCYGSENGVNYASVAPQMLKASSCQKQRRRIVQKIKPRKDVNVEDVIVKVGESEGEFKEFRGYNIERNVDFPVRVTVQYYKSTSNGEVNHEIVQSIAKQLKETQNKADFIGSLVVGDDSELRPTNPDLEKDNFYPLNNQPINNNQPIRPDWDFFEPEKPNFPQIPDFPMNLQR